MTVEQLMNKLIAKGWRPFNKDIREIFTLNEFTCGYRGEGTNHLGTIRAIVSKESGLWQFVCENEMVALKLSARMKNPRIDWEDVDDYNNGHIVMNYKQKCEGDKAEYRLIESSLKDESGLEDFLLSNIVIKDE